MREVRQIAVTFNDLADRLASQDRDRLAFLASVAHDLRNPLTPIKLAIVRLRSQKPSAETCEKVLRVVEKQVERLDRMVGDLLDATRIESGQLELHPRAIDLRALVTSVADLYRPASEAHAIEVVAPDEPLIVNADPLRIEQVVINLVSNAIKYSPGGGRVTIHLSASEAHDIVAVSDEGIGIPPEEKERIFEPFHRTGRSRETVPGVGLGLAVARKIARAHGGNLDVETSDKGSTFRLTLPV